MTSLIDVSNMFTAPSSARSSVRAPNAARGRRATSVTALFGRKKAAEPPPPPPKVKKSFGFGGAKTPTPAKESAKTRDFEVVREESKAEAYARIRKARERSRKEFEAREKGGLAYGLFQVARALDFQEDIAADRGLLKAARSMKKGESMSQEQYGALRRKVGGTKGGFFGESVDVEGKYVDRGYVDVDQVGTDVLGAPFLAAVLVGVLGTTIWVALQVP